jgi:uncharacterized membrane protein (UPF0136 family)
MNLTGTVILIYGIVTLTGGIYGYVSKASTASLIAGGVSGIILVVCAVLIFKRIFAGVYIALVVALVLAVHFGLSFSKEMKLMPAGVMLVLSLFAVGFTIYALSQKSTG